MFKTVAEGIQALPKRALEKKSPEQALYIAAQGAEGQEVNAVKFDLCEKMKAFYDSIQHPHPSQAHKVCLMLGEAGSGKSVFCQAFTRQLWEQFKEGDPIPLYISLVHLKKPFGRAIEETLLEAGFNEKQIAELKAKYSFLFILDGFDELHKWDTNIYDANDLSQWKNKTIITCRSQSLYFIKDPLKCFLPAEQDPAQPSLLRQVWVALFSNSQIDSYLQRHAELSKVETPLTRTDFEKVPGLTALITNPFMLYLTVDALPAILGKYGDPKTQEQFKVTQTALYDAFAISWFSRQEKKLRAAGHIKAAEHDPKPEFWKFCKDFATQLYQRDITCVNYRPEEYDFDDPWESLLGSKPRVQMLRSACPLREPEDGQQGETGFWHASFIEYFAARGVYDTDEKSSSSDDLLRTKLFVDDIKFQKFFVDGLADVEKGASLKKRLFDDIHASKTNATYAIAAANALTILTRAGISLSNEKFKDVNAPRANLENGTADSTDWTNANLEGANATGLWMRNGIFNGTRMKNMQYGEFAYLNLPQTVNACCYLPKTEGVDLALACGEEIYIYDAKTYSLKEQYAKHPEGITHLAAHPTGRYLASAGYDHHIYLWDVASGNRTHCFEGHTLSVSCVAFHPDPKQPFLFSEGLDKTIRIWNYEKKKEVAVLKHHTENITALAVTFNKNTNDEKREEEDAWLASASIDKTVCVWNLKKLSSKQSVVLQHTLRDGHSWGVNSLAFHPYRPLLASGGKDRKICLWDYKQGVLLQTFEGHKESIDHLCFYIHTDVNEGEYLISSGKDATVRLWNVVDYNKKDPIQTIEGYSGMITGMAKHPQGQWLACACVDKTVRLKNIGKQLFANTEKQTSDVTCLTVLPNSSWIITGGKDKTLTLWDRVSLHPIYTLRRHNEKITSVASDPQGHYFITGSADERIALWDIKNRANEKEEFFFTGHMGTVEAVAFHPRLRQFASGSGDSSVRLWDIHERVLLQVYRGHTGAVSSLAFSRDGKWLFSGGSDKKIYMWSLQSHTSRHIFQGHENGILSIAVHPECHWFISGSIDKTLRIWEVGSGQHKYTFNGHDKAVTVVTFDPKARWVVSASLDQTVRFWNIKTRKCEMVLKGFTGGVTSLDWIQEGDSTYLITSSEDRALRYWEVFLEENRLKVVLLKSNQQSTLVANGAQIEEAIDLDVPTRNLLEQRGAKKINVAPGRSPAVASDAELVAINGLLALPPNTHMRGRSSGENTRSRSAPHSRDDGKQEDSHLRKSTCRQM